MIQIIKLPHFNRAKGNYFKHQSCNKQKESKSDKSILVVFVLNVVINECILVCLTQGRTVSK